MREKAQSLGDQLASIANKQAQIEAFRALKGELKATRDAMEAARAKVAALQAQYDSTERPTRKMAAALRNAIAESDRLTAAFHAQTAALNQHKGRMEAAGISTDRLSDVEGRLRQEASRTDMQLHALADEAGARLASARLKAADAADRRIARPNRRARIETCPWR